MASGTGMVSEIGPADRVVAVAVAVGSCTGGIVGAFRMRAADFVGRGVGYRVVEVEVEVAAEAGAGSHGSKDGDHDTSPGRAVHPCRDHRGHDQNLCLDLYHRGSLTLLLRMVRHPQLVPLLGP